MVVQEVQPQPGARDCFVHVEEAGVPYLAELFWWDSQGRWLLLATSNVVMTPPDMVSPDETVEWARPPHPPAAAAKPVSEQGLERGPLPSPLIEQPPAPQGCAVAPGVLSISEKLSREVPEKVFQSGLLAAAAEAESGPRVSIAAPGPSHPQPGKRERVAVFVEPSPSLASAMVEQHPSSAELARQGGDRVGRIDFAAPGLELGPGEVLSISPISSLEMPEAVGPGLPGQERGFWFKVNAELTIYGSTEQDAHLFIGNRPVPLRADGSFSFRFALPDGVYSLPIEAWSAGGAESRQAEMVFSRLTRTKGEVAAHPHPPGLRPPAPESL